MERHSTTSQLISLIPEEEGDNLLVSNNNNKDDEESPETEKRNSLFSLLPQEVVLHMLSFVHLRYLLSSYIFVSHTAANQVVRLLNEHYTDLKQFIENLQRWTQIISRFHYIHNHTKAFRNVASVRDHNTQRIRDFADQYLQNVQRCLDSFHGLPEPDLNDIINRKRKKKPELQPDIKKLREECILKVLLSTWSFSQLAGKILFTRLTGSHRIAPDSSFTVSFQEAYSVPEGKLCLHKNSELTCQMLGICAMTMWINTPFSHLTPWRMTRESVHYLTQALVDKSCKIQRMILDMGTPEQRDQFQFVFHEESIYLGGFNDLCAALEQNTSVKSLQVGKTWDPASLVQLFNSLRVREENVNALSAQLNRDFRMMEQEEREEYLAMNMMKVNNNENNGESWENDILQERTSPRLNLSNSPRTGSSPRNSNQLFQLHHPRLLNHIRELVIGSEVKIDGFPQNLDSVIAAWPRELTKLTLLNSFQDCIHYQLKNVPIKHLTFKSVINEDCLVSCTRNFISTLEVLTLEGANFTSIRCLTDFVNLITFHSRIHTFEIIKMPEHHVSNNLSMLLSIVSEVETLRVFNLKQTMASTKHFRKFVKRLAWRKARGWAPLKTFEFSVKLSSILMNPPPQQQHLPANINSGNSNVNNHNSAVTSLNTINNNSAVGIGNSNALLTNNGALGNPTTTSHHHGSGGGAVTGTSTTNVISITKQDVTVNGTNVPRVVANIGNIKHVVKEYEDVFRDLSFVYSKGILEYTGSPPRPQPQPAITTTTTTTTTTTAAAANGAPAPPPPPPATSSTPPTITPSTTIKTYDYILPHVNFLVPIMPMFNSALGGAMSSYGSASGGAAGSGGSGGSGSAGARDGGAAGASASGTAGGTDNTIFNSNNVIMGGGPGLDHSCMFVDMDDKQKRIFVVDKTARKRVIYGIAPDRVVEAFENANEFEDSSSTSTCSTSSTTVCSSTRCLVM